MTLRRLCSSSYCPPTRPQHILGTQHTHYNAQIHYSSKAEAESAREAVRTFDVCYGTGQQLLVVALCGRWLLLPHHAATESACATPASTQGILSFGAGRAVLQPCLLPYT